MRASLWTYSISRPSRGPTHTHSHTGLHIPRGGFPFSIVHCESMWTGNHLALNLFYGHENSFLRPSFCPSYRFNPLVIFIRFSAGFPYGRRNCGKLIRSELSRSQTTVHVISLLNLLVPVQLFLTPVHSPLCQSSSRDVYVDYDNPDPLQFTCLTFPEA